jgi:hypothetical protein
MMLLKLFAFMFCLQREFATVADMAVKLYYENVPTKMYYSAFYKHLLVCDPGLWTEFLQEI